MPFAQKTKCGPFFFCLFVYFFPPSNQLNFIKVPFQYDKFKPLILRLSLTKVPIIHNHHIHKFSLMYNFYFIKVAHPLIYSIPSHMSNPVDYHQSLICVIHHDQYHHFSLISIILSYLNVFQWRDNLTLWKSIFLI